MPRKSKESETEQFSVTLPLKAVRLMEELVDLGLFGSSRGEVARNLILDRLKQLAAYKLVKTDSTNKDIGGPLDRV